MDEKPNSERLGMSVPEAGAMLGLGKNASYEAVKKGVIPVMRVGKRLIVPIARFRRMVDQEEVK